MGLARKNTIWTGFGQEINMRAFQLPRPRPRMGGLRPGVYAYSASEIYAKFSGNIKIK
tara:strand:- start:1489 stop:1662 length:174 start_codon:yes stop_codon:yes gene_type:complete